MLVTVQRIFGALMIAAALVWLRWSELRAEHTPSSSIFVATPERIDPALEGERIAVRGPVEGAAPISDGEFLSPGPYVVVERRIHRYDRVMRPGRSPDRSITELAWTELRASGPIARVELAANPARLGVYTFDASLPDFGELSRIDASRDGVTRNHRKALDDGAFYPGREGHEAPDVGDVRVTVRVLRAGAVLTLIGRQQGGAIVPAALPGEEGEARLIATPQTLAERIADERAAVRGVVWMWRMVVALAVVLGVCLVAFPRRSAAALRTAANRTIQLSLWYVALAALVIPVSDVSGDLITVGLVAGFLAFAWGMASLPSGPRPLR